jgi:uncharacterized protein
MSAVTVFSGSSCGRGLNYSRPRSAWEWALRRLYRGAWPARLWARVPGATRVERVDLVLPVLPPGLPRLRLAFASDLHFGPTTPPATLARALEHLVAARPDLLVLGGDYVFLDATAEAVDGLSRWAATVPARTKVAVLGNHDLWADDRAVEQALEAAGAEVLVNSAVTLPAPHRSVAVVGLDDPFAGRPDGAHAFAEAEGAALVIAVCHSPDGLDHVAGRGAALLLTGHTHGGQVALPGHVPIIVPGRLGRRYPFGLHRVGATHLFVSRGLGGVEVPLRAWASPDVAVIDLVAP